MKNMSDIGTHSAENEQKNKDERDEATSPCRSCLESHISAVKLLFSHELLLMVPLFLYSGFLMSFYQGVYTTAIGNTHAMPERMGTVGLIGLLIGIGEVFGGGMFVFGAKLTNK